MNYWDNINFLQRGLAAGAIPGDEALSSLMELDQARMEAKQARKQAAAEATQGALDSLVSTAQTAATEGTPFSQIKPLLDAIASSGGIQGINYRQSPGIAGLYKGNYSAVNPTLDVEDESDIMNQVFNKVQVNPLGTPLHKVRYEVHQSYAGAPGYERLVPAIDAVIEEAYDRATKGS